MKPQRILMAMLVVGALSAQDSSSGLSPRVLLFGESIQTRGIQLGPNAEDKANRQTGPGIRIMSRFADDSPWNWELAARFQSSAQ